MPSETAGDTYYFLCGRCSDGVDTSSCVSLMIYIFDLLARAGVQTGRREWTILQNHSSYSLSGQLWNVWNGGYIKCSWSTPFRVSCALDLRKL